MAVKNIKSVHKSQYKGLDVNQQDCSHKNGDSIRYPWLGLVDSSYRAYASRTFSKNKLPTKMLTSLRHLIVESVHTLLVSTLQALKTELNRCQLKDK